MQVPYHNSVNSLYLRLRKGADVMILPGLGLAVVAHIIRQLGGQLRVDSKPGNGSRFSFILPFGLPGRSGSEALIPMPTSRPSSRAISLSGKSDRDWRDIDYFLEAMSDPRSRSSQKNSSSREQVKELDNNDIAPQPSIKPETVQGPPTEAAGILSPQNSVSKVSPDQVSLPSPEASPTADLPPSGKKRNMQMQHNNLTVSSLRILIVEVRYNSISSLDAC